LSIQCLKKNPEINIFGNNYSTYDGTCIRDYIHVSDLADIHLKALIKINKYNKSTILNCGYGKGCSVLEIVKSFEKISKRSIKINYSPRRKGDITEIISNTKKLKGKSKTIVGEIPTIDFASFLIFLLTKWAF